MKVTITKRFGRKISHDWQTWEFLTEITYPDVEYSTAEELDEINERIFMRVKGLTDADIASVSNEIKPKKLGDTNGKTNS